MAITPLLSLADAELAQTDRHRGIAAGRAARCIRPACCSCTGRWRPFGRVADERMLLLASKLGALS